jgi:hypothetical protein
MSFWEMVWLFLISFAFMAYLMVLFAIISDLFRDSQASGLAKAGWMIALIFLPFITSAVYLIAKGRPMRERQARGVEQMRVEQDAYIRQVAGSAVPTEQIARAKSMLDAGNITSAEYERLKEKALA